MPAVAMAAVGTMAILSAAHSAKRAVERLATRSEIQSVTSASAAALAITAQPTGSGKVTPASRAWVSAPTALPEARSGGRQSPAPERNRCPGEKDKNPEDVGEEPEAQQTAIRVANRRLVL